jgi:DNA mismatch endonuclease (patch repair protein)
MGRIRGRDTRPEMLVRCIIHGLGFRYRLHAKELPGTPDIVFRRRKVAIFVHGCFWHRHPDPTCKLARMPNSRIEFWQAKLDRNRERDLEVQAGLEALGWKVLVIWECQTSKLDQLESIIRGTLVHHEVN